ncbi:lantibiotic dehydratase [Micromonospora sp. SH-82]|uniref:lantibiotic dehydratase n=1 Tax=Micromonospora sp. SH-82 TaxID=3132938 RepID=UPI003EBFF54A
MYRHLDALVVRAAVCPPDAVPYQWPDLTGEGAGAASWRPWLQEVLAGRAFSATLEQASPELAERARAICGGSQVGERAARRVVLSVMRYLLRATGRATPYGLFAGVAPIRLAPTAAVRIGDGHRPVARTRAQWLAELVDTLEADPALLPRLMVRANNLLTYRDGQVVLEDRPCRSLGAPPTHLHVRASGPVRAALAAARDPIRLGDLARQLAMDHEAARGRVFTLLAEMVSQQLLLTSLRPGTMCTDPLSALADGVAQALTGTDDQETLAPARRLLRKLDTLREQAVRHDAAPAIASGTRRARLAATMNALHPTDGPPVAVDLRLDLELRLPAAVALEAATAAAALLRLAPAPRTGWAAWHSRFLERYGPGALVPVRDAVNPDVGLGFPAGYRGIAPAPPATLTDRDRKLLALAQDATLRRKYEVVLDDAMISELAAEEPVAAIQPSSELTLTVHARIPEEIDQGTFRLQVVGVSRNAGTTTGRFLDLLDPPDRDRITGQYAALPTTTRGALLAQVAAATVYTATEDLARAPQVLPHVITLGKYHDDATNRIPLDDIAVTADANRVYLTSISRRRPVEPIVLNAVEQVHYTLPIVRFLAEAPTAFAAQCGAFDWGAASALPFLPALHYQRTILSPARWLLAATALPSVVASWQEWTRALAGWRDSVGCPARIHLGGSDQRIGLDLAEPAHQALLRDHLHRSPTAVLRAAPPPEAAGWFNGYPHEIVVPLVATTAPAPPPRWSASPTIVDIRTHGNLPGRADGLYLKLYGHPDRQTRILTRHLPNLLQQLDPGTGCWFLRYSDPDPHLRIRFTGATNSARISEWVEGLRRASLTSRAQIDTDYPETGRLGGPSAATAVEEVFAADSATTLALLAALERDRASDIYAVTAASMLNIATAFIGAPEEARRWLIDHTRPHRSAPPRVVYQQAIQLADPNQSGLATLTDDRLLDTWDRRHRALHTYRETLEGLTVAPESVLPDLLHLHHARVIGPDLESERRCLHLARAAALSWNARTGGPQ